MSSQEMPQPEPNAEQIAASFAPLTEEAVPLLMRGYGILLDDVLYQISTKPVDPLAYKPSKHRRGRNLSSL